MSESATYLITGAGRGLGRGLAKALLQRPNTTVIAAMRSPDQASDLASLLTHSASRLITVTIDSRSPKDALVAVEKLVRDHGVESIDVVVANAGISKIPTAAAETPIEDVLDCFNVNAVAPLLLFQATWRLLRRSSAPKFVVISSIAGSLGEVPRYASPCSAYGSSKAAVNFLVRRIGSENERLIALALHPGWMQTEMGNAAAVRFGKKEAPVEVAGAVNSILIEIDQATRESAAAFRTYDHKELPW
ncbi:short-chain dehydrogenase [Colletotrichum orchidophilum]|uniref:Short-chain dehydrogenase n=1 Tax=Colletotrichum orchidophilum TaxID=1209926 RepID=A0A1G4ARC4_9PEZI|nr:short-chain dehydrogenase [Colletotrichum orchidophilum]OHE91572.1 short-chain dehydrogenase [Colletotrichum orchidophilum]